MIEHNDVCLRLFRSRSLLASLEVTASILSLGSRRCVPTCQGKGQTSERGVSQKGNHTGLSRGLLVGGGPIRRPRKLGKKTGYFEKAPGPSQARDSIIPENKAPSVLQYQPVGSLHGSRVGPKTSGDLV